jgi:hypothetical protein
LLLLLLLLLQAVHPLTAAVDSVGRQWQQLEPCTWRGRQHADACQVCSTF